IASLETASMLPVHDTGTTTKHKDEKPTHKANHSFLVDTASSPCRSLKKSSQYKVTKTPGLDKKRWLCIMTNSYPRLQWSRCITCRVSPRLLPERVSSNSSLRCRAHVPEGGSMQIRVHNHRS